MVQIQMLEDMPSADFLQFLQSDLAKKMHSKWQCTPLSIEYYKEYFGENYKNKSFVFMNNNEYLCGIFSYTNSEQLDYFGMPAVFESVGKMKEEDYRIFFHLLTPFLLKYDITSIKMEAQPYFTSIFFAAVKEQFLQYRISVDLRRPLDDIYHAMRKSYRPLINSALRNDVIEVMDYSNANRAVFDEFHLLHKKVAGRETRSLKSWQLQYEAILNKQAFAVFHRQNNICVSFVYILISSDTAYYGVAATDRTLMTQKSLFSHALLYKAIEHSRSMGANEFILNNTQLNISDGKLINIDFFKKGFTETISCIPVLIFDLQKESKSLLSKKQ